MGYYFEDHRSIFAHCGADIEPALAAISGRYVGQNPPHPLTFRAYFEGGIRPDTDYRAHIDFDALLPGAAPGQLGIAWTRLWSETAASLKFDVSCMSPTRVFCNGPAFTSTIFTERDPQARHRILIGLSSGWNHIVVISRKTVAGFGCVFGTWLGKQPYSLMMPTKAREGREGWLFAGPLAGDPETLPGLDNDADDLAWLPSMEWDAERSAQGRLQRIFGITPKAVAVGWTRGSFTRAGVGTYRCRGRGTGPVSIHVADKEVYRSGKSGEIDAKIEVPFGMYDVMVFCGCAGRDWGFSLSILDGEKEVAFGSPCNIRGTDLPWIFSGPFDAASLPDPARLKDLRKPVPTLNGDSYWRVDLPDTWVRPDNENPLYGHWNYPLGVTLYGLLHAARETGSKETLSYVRSHVQFSVDMFGYALWDKARHGGAVTLLRNLAGIDSLDDCGSFGSLLLEAASELGIEGFREIADYVAAYISRTQARLPDGSFYRKKLMHGFHEETMWADDLYMSVPFLCRYYRLTGDAAYIDDAARQFLGFRKRLFIPEWKLMSHVFDGRRGIATGVPWGRGNGWTAFSLSELLAVLPEDHGERPAVLSMFRELCEGFLSRQDSAGMWHQVLTDHESYPEASCTAMFACAFARGARHGWLPDPGTYADAAFKAWEGLARTCVDAGGNVYGVCRGSEFSFSPDYYKNELSWNLNDTHGTGILLLAGVEILRLKKALMEPLTGA